MEFEYVGRHCALPSCKQKDFLPFKCNYCTKEFCISHRSYASHGCAGCISQDITSLDCPLCGKTVKYDKSQDIHVIWDEHYLYSCPHELAIKGQQKLKKETCYRKGCSTVLGLSNTYQCPKCHQKVCLSHRLPEDHHCSSLLGSKQTGGGTGTGRDAFLNKVEQQQQKKPTSSSAPKKPISNNSGSGKKGTVANPPDNTLRGSAARRQPQQQGQYQQTQQATGSSSSLLCGCPFDCGANFSTMSEVQQHIDIAHGDASNSTGGSNNNNNNEVAGGKGGGRDSGAEICPICQQRFVDTISLINHYEVVHWDGAGGATTATTNNTSSSSSQCYLS